MGETPHFNKSLGKASTYVSRKLSHAVLDLNVVFRTATSVFRIVTSVFRTATSVVILVMLLGMCTQSSHQVDRVLTALRNTVPRHDTMTNS